jgi:hypothetical protein
MTVPRVTAVGFCAHYSEQGDWAFEYALRLSRQNDLQLNVFHFLSDPYNPDDDREKRYSKSGLAQLAFEKERELRLYYDELAGDYLEVGFRLCFDDSWRELHRCLTAREFQVLVLAKPQPGTMFSGKPIEAFAEGFVCPVIIVGPDKPNQLHLNSSAGLLSDRFVLEECNWELIDTGKGSLLRGAGPIRGVGLTD